MHDQKCKPTQHTRRVWPWPWGYGQQEVSDEGVRTMLVQLRMVTIIGVGVL